MSNSFTDNLRRVPPGSPPMLTEGCAICLRTLHVPYLRGSWVCNTCGGIGRKYESPLDEYWSKRTAGPGTQRNAVPEAGE